MEDSNHSGTAVLSRDDFAHELDRVMDVAYALAYRLSGDRDVAMDLVQDAALQAFRGRHTFQIGSNFKAWFLRVVTNRFLKTRPRAQRDRQLLALEDAEDVFLFKRTAEAGLHQSAADPAAAVMDRLDAEAVQDALERLPDEFREVAILSLVHEYRYDEIAEMLGIPIGTVRSRLFRGRRLLQKALWEVAQGRGFGEAEGAGSPE